MKNKVIERKHKPRFGERFPPKSIAIVGISRNDMVNVPGYTGLNLFRSLRDTGFKGRIYPVNPKAREIEGVKAYASLQEIPEPLDLVIITVPAAVVPQVMDDCVEAEAHYVHICTSGFSETGEPEGRLLENQVLEKALNSGIKVIGPNCMGFIVPSVHMNMFFDLKDIRNGSVAFISQSGGLAHTFMENGPELGIGFSKVISYGNGIMLDALDFLEYLAYDSETEIICLYLEGMRQGRRFIRLVKEINPLKPVIVWKAGLTDSGSRAAASHTGSMAGQKDIWKGLFRQTGAIEASTLQEMAEAAMVFQNLPRITGTRAVVLGAGGGSTVSNGDICAREGLEIPPLASKTREGLLQLTSIVNQGLANPMDVSALLTQPDKLNRALLLFMQDPLIEILLFSIPLSWTAGRWGGLEFKETIINFHQENDVAKPFVVAVSDDWYAGYAEPYIRELREAGITVFRSLSRAARTLKRFAGYYQFISS